jgi:hypothetical protein
MNSMFLVALLILTAVVSYPEIYDLIAGLESMLPKPEARMRLAQSIGALAAAFLLWLRRDWFLQGSFPYRALMASLGIVWLELVLRLFFKWIAPLFGSASAIGKWEHSLRQYCSTMGEMSWMDPRPHPFLQFTAVRWTSRGERGLGFGNITVSRIPKPTGVVRVACLGNSTTFDNYPERLEDFLNRCGGGLRFEILNFGTGWWASVHTMLNFVLNVRDFHPDFVVVHENCNDEKFRGYAGLRGDYAHAIRPLRLWRYRDAWLYRFSLIYRLGIILVSKQFPRVYYFPHIGVAMNRGKTPDYIPGELQLFRRNIATICDLAAAEGIKVIIPTMPFSKLHRYTQFDETRFHPHLLGANAVLRELSNEKAVALVELERMFMDKDSFFRDGFHLDEVGVGIKALEIGKTILCSLGIDPVLDAQWREVELSKPPVDPAP